MDLAAVIAVRKGSVRIKDKNGLCFGDKDSLIAWKISQLAQVLPKQNIYLSTEAQDYQAIGLSEGIQIHERDPRLADTNQCSWAETVEGIVSDIPHEHIAWCPVTNPLMAPFEYKKAFELYEEEVIHGQFDSLMGVNLLKEYLWDDKGSLNYEASANHIYSQDLPNIYKVTHSIHIRDRASILKDRYHTGPNPYKMEVSKLAGIDIDYQEDYDIAVALYPLYQKTIASQT